jgi:hypothetical protein
METILRDIAFALARAAVATFLSRELYAVTVPSLIVFSALAFAVLTQDPIRRSLPPFIGVGGVWKALNCQSTCDEKGLVRASFFGRDVFWITRVVVFKELFGMDSGHMSPLYQTSKGLVMLNELERRALENVFLLLFRADKVVVSYQRCDLSGTSLSRSRPLG